MNASCLSLEVCAKLRDYTPRLVGGCVRDAQLSKIPKDFDIVSTATFEQVKSIFSKIDGYTILEVGKAFGITILVFNGIQIEVAAYRKETGYSDSRHPDKVEFITDTTPSKDGIPLCVVEDSKRRDLTFNALYYDLENSVLEDPQNGLADLLSNTIRFIGTAMDRIIEDPLRLLRFVRFKFRFDCEVNYETFKAIQTNVAMVKSVSAERIGEELTRILTGKNAGDAMLFMQQTGLLEVVLPEVSKLCHDKGQQTRKFHPEGNVLAHTCFMLNGMREPSPVLAWGVLLHDIAKPDTFKVIEGIITNRGHAELGAKMAETILKKLKFSNDLIDAVAVLVKYHMTFGSMTEMRLSKVKRMISRDTFDDELELHRLDCRFSSGNLENYFFAIKARKEIPPEEVKPEWFINGNDLIKMGMKTGQELGAALERLHTMQLDGENKETIWKEAESVIPL